MKIAVSYFEKLDWWPNKNFKGICDSLLDLSCKATVVKKYTPEELLHTKDYDAVFLLRGGDAMSDEHIRHYRKNDVLVAIWHDDIFRWKNLSLCRHDIYVWKLRKFACHPKGLMKWFDVADILFLPYVNAFFKFKKYDKYKHKVVWLPWSASDSIMHTNVEWSSRKDKILLSGRMSGHYVFRTAIRHYSLTDSGKSIIDSIEHYGYKRESQNNMITGQRYYDLLMTYKGAVATSSISASDFHRAKYLEITACGCLPFLQYTPDIHFLGFVDGINCILIDKYNFRQKFALINSDRANIIANNARELVRERHLHSHRARTIISTITKKLELR